MSEDYLNGILWFFSFGYMSEVYDSEYHITRSSASTAVNYGGAKYGVHLMQITPKCFWKGSVEVRSIN